MAFVGRATDDLHTITINLRNLGKESLLNVVVIVVRQSLISTYCATSAIAPEAGYNVGFTKEPA